MTEKSHDWQEARNRLVRETAKLGFPEELGDLMAKQLGSPKAIDRMSAYLIKARPRTIEMAVDEMLAICSEIDAWKQKKQAEEANAAYNEIFRRR